MISVDTAVVERIIEEIVRQLAHKNLPDIDLFSYIEHTLLRPDATYAQVDHLCAEALAHRFAAVCVSPRYVAHAREQLHKSDVKVVSVVGFPHGTSLTSTKKAEAESLIECGAHELDMVLPLGAIKSQDWRAIADDITAIVNAKHESKDASLQVKVILETGLLTQEEIVAACVIAQDFGADFVKTSTGFNGPGATVADVMLMRQVVGDTMGIKAAGGIRSQEQAHELIRAGATRIGTSSGPALLESRP